MTARVEPLAIDLHPLDALRRKRGGQAALDGAHSLDPVGVNGLDGILGKGCVKKVHDLDDPACDAPYRLPPGVLKLLLRPVPVIDEVRLHALEEFFELLLLPKGLSQLGGRRGVLRRGRPGLPGVI